MPDEHLAHSTKSSIPQRPREFLHRPRLVEFLHAHIHRKLILVCAAAGYGKSSLLIDFAQDTELPVVWFRMDATDRDVAALATNLVTALQLRFPAFESSLPAVLSEPGTRPEQMASALAREIRTGLEDYFVLILDDAHVIEDSEEVIRFFDTLLIDLPEQAHLLIGARSIPPLRIASLAARQQVAGLGEEHLRFAPDEVQALIRMINRVDVPDADAERLVSDTDGWITGILLTTRLMWRGLVAQIVEARQAEGPLYEYLAEEVLDQQPEQLRQFLLESSVLPEMQPSLCDVVLERSDSADMLHEAESHRLFVNVIGDEFRAYQYHPLFRDFLLARLRSRYPQRHRTLLARAADWYVDNQMPEAAITFYVAAGQLARAAEVTGQFAEQTFASGRYEVLRSWAEQLRSVTHETPALYLFLAKADTDRGDLTQAESHLEKAAIGFSRKSDEVGNLRVEIQRGLIKYRRGEFEDALRVASTAISTARRAGREKLVAQSLRYAGLCQLALGSLDLAEGSLSQAEQLLTTLHLNYDLALVLGDLALVFRLQGKTSRCAQVQRRALAIWRELSAPGPLALTLNNIGVDLHMLGQFEGALATYAEALEWARRAGSVRLECMIEVGQADVFADLGDHRLASDLYRHALARVERIGEWSLIAYVRRALARLDRHSGNYVGALEWLRRAAEVTGKGKAETPLANLDGLRGMVLVEMGHIREGRQQLEAVCDDLEQSGSPIDLAQTLLFRACAEFRDGDLARATASLMRAFEVAEEVGYDQMLVSEAAFSSGRDLLEAVSQRKDIGFRATGLLARAEHVTMSRQRPERVAELPVEHTSQPRPTLKVCALGHSRVLRGCSEISRTEWASQKTRELFFFLVDRVTEAASIPRDAVLDVFWPDKTQSRGAANLHQTLYRLRRAVGHEVVTLEDQVCRRALGLDLDYDVQVFESEARAALALAAHDLRRPGALASVIDLYTGDYLADMPVDWAQDRRRELRDLHVTLLRAYADELMSLTRYLEARKVLTKALASEPLRDDLHERMLLCLAKMGRRHEVVVHYGRYRETLRNELGLDPPREMRALYAQLIE